MKKTLCALLFLMGCGDDIIIPIPTPTPTPDPIITPTPTMTPNSMNPSCNSVMGVDGPGGFLWKPKSDSNGNAVVLLPGTFQARFDRVEKKRKDGQTESFTFTGFSNFDQDGLRQTWRGSKPGGSYTSNSNVVATLGDTMCKWKIGNSSERND